MSKRWWVWLMIVASFTGLLFGLGMTLMYPHHDWRHGLLEGVLFAVFFGTFFGVFMGKAMRQQRSAMGEVSAEQVRSAARMLRSKSIPTDPELRETMYRLATCRLELARRWRIPSFVILGLGILLEIFEASQNVGWYSWFFWDSAVFSGFVLALTQWQVVRFSRRIEMLHPSSEGSQEAG